MKETKEFLYKFIIIILSIITITTIYWHITISKVYYETNKNLQDDLDEVRKIKNELWDIVNIYEKWVSDM